MVHFLKLFKKKLNRDEDKVLMDDIVEQLQLAGELSTAISNPVGFDQDVDEVYRKLDRAELINKIFAKKTFFQSMICCIENWKNCKTKILIVNY